MPLGPGLRACSIKAHFSALCCAALRHKKGAAPHCAAPPLCTLESPVSKVEDGQLGDIELGPASSVPVISPFRDTSRRTLASALAQDVIGPRSHGRRAQTARNLHCSLDSPPSDGRLVGSDAALAYSSCSRLSHLYAPVSELSADGCFLPADGTTPTSRARSSASSRLECTPRRV